MLLVKFSVKLIELPKKCRSSEEKPKFQKFSMDRRFLGIFFKNKPPLLKMTPSYALGIVPREVRFKPLFKFDLKTARPKTTTK